MFDLLLLLLDPMISFARPDCELLWRTEPTASVGVLASRSAPKPALSENVPTNESVPAAVSYPRSKWQPFNTPNGIRFLCPNLDRPDAVETKSRLDWVSPTG